MNEILFLELPSLKKLFSYYFKIKSAKNKLSGLYLLMTYK